MANAGHIDLVRDRIDHWNDWRRKNSRIVLDFAGADLSELNLAGANLARADLSGARLAGANLSGANLSRAKLFRADLSQADLSRANLFKANLSQADLAGANFNGADLSGAFLIRANLSGASLLGACLKGASLGQASLFRARLGKAVLSQASFFKADLTEADLAETDLDGRQPPGGRARADQPPRGQRWPTPTSASPPCSGRTSRTPCSTTAPSTARRFWDVAAADSSQRDLDIMPAQQPVLSVDSLQTAQLVGMLLHHEKARYEVFSITLNTVLVIGRFPPERKPVLAAIKEALRRGDYSPLVLDFHLPGSGDKNEIVKTLGRMSRFVVADLTGDRRIAETLDAVVHFLPSIPIQPIGQAGDGGESVADSHYGKYRWVLPFWRFRDPSDLAARIGREVVEPAERKSWPRSGSDTSSPPARV
ncbi:MAG: pentapeptide repeat-containing protein [Candidatus Moduliflexus flocculans]|nr:pentapeptide repeat-containing protein [Candidatus Moduliflexus flocculans]